MSTGQTFIAVREFSARGKAYKPGDVIDPKDWPFRRIELLVDNRFIRRSTPSQRRYFALRPLALGDKNYAKGDQIDVTDLSQAKLDQMCDLRHIHYTDVPQPPNATAKPIADVKGK